jgi:hypothetical protein
MGRKIVNCEEFYILTGIENPWLNHENGHNRVYKIYYTTHDIRIWIFLGQLRPWLMTHE